MASRSLRPEFRRIQEVGDVEAQGQIAVAAEFVVEIELCKISAGAVDARKAIFVGPLDSGAQRGKFFSASGRWNDLGDQIAELILSTRRWLRRFLDREQ